MPWVDVFWTDENEQHVRDSGLEPGEVEHVLHNPIGHDVSESSGRPIAFGYTPQGRKVAVVYEVVDEFTVYPITAYDVE